MLRAVVDTNKVIASLLRDGRVRRAFFHPYLEILMPSYVLDEIRKHRNYLETKVPSKAIDYFLSRVTKRVKVIEPKEISKENIRTAKDIARNFDIDNYPFIAVALEYNAIIWTNDKELLKYSLIESRYLAVDSQGIEMLLSGQKLDDVIQIMKNKYLST